MKAKNIVLIFLILQLNSFMLNSLDNSSAGQTIEAELKLKKVDYNYYTITFYDEENLDIRFDLLKYYSMNRFKKTYKLKNIHPGALYRVKFKIIDINNGIIEGDLISYSPIFLDKLP